VAVNRTIRAVTPSLAPATTAQRTVLDLLKTTTTA
jgi:hypothetical protein